MNRIKLDSSLKSKIDDILLRTVNVLLLNASFIDNLGLLNGKMGIAIFFYHYSRYKNDKLFDDFAGELIDQVFREVYDNSPDDFTSGLTGLGLGVEYLIQNGFVETGNDNILEELDNAIFQLNYKNPRLKRVFDDFYGYGLYYLYHAKSDVWKEEALQLIWNDLKTLLQGTLLDEVKLRPSYIISLLYFINEVQIRTYCPSGIDEMITAIPEFVSKYMEENLNINEYHYLDFLLQNLGIVSFLRPQTITDQLTIEEQFEIYGQAAFYAIVFPNIHPTIDYAYKSKFGLLDLLENEEFWKNILGLINPRKPGISSYAIYALLFLETDPTPSKRQITRPTSRDTICIFNRKSRAAEYGIGTYLKELTSVLKSMTFNIIMIYLESDRLEFVIENHDDIQNWYIPLSRNYRSSGISYNEYYKSIVVLMRLYLRPGKLVFHFNSMLDYQLAIYLRESFKCKILLVIHYLEWTFALHGDISRMRSILTMPKESILDPLEAEALKLFEADRKLLRYVDHIISLSYYSRDLLCQEYGIESGKITVINNGASDRSKTLTNSEKAILREKFKIDPDEKIILCAGRLDEIKGIIYLIKAFRDVLKRDPNCRLWIVGDGAYNPLLKEARGIWNKLCFTGQIEQEQLYDLYSIADIGVIPSLFEPFGYVAIEMMMHSLPLVVTATSGLDEIIKDDVSGLKVPMKKHKNGFEVNTEILAEKIICLLQNPEERIRLGQNGRMQFLEEYTAAPMGEKTSTCYRKLLISFAEKELNPSELQ